MAFKTSSGKVATTQYGEPYIWGTGDVTTLPSNESIITPSDGGAFDSFGHGKVKIGNGKIVIADEDNNGSSAVYVYNLDGTNEIKITQSDGAANDRFGNSVAVGSGRIVVGAFRDDDNGSDSGSAYIYNLDGTNEIKITPSDGAASDNFGISVAVGNDRIVVGAYADDDNGSSSGSAYIYNLDGTNEIKITPSDGAASDRFGEVVAVGNDRIVVGADSKDINTGAVYIFDLDGNQLAKLSPPNDGYTNTRGFGSSVAVGSGRIVVSEYFRGNVHIYDLDGNLLKTIEKPTELNVYSYFGSGLDVGSGRIVIGLGNPGYPADSNYPAGKAYIYDLDGNLLTKLTTLNSATFIDFGLNVAVGNGKIAVGAPGDDTLGTGSGAVYIYDTPSVYTVYELIHNEV